MNTLILPYKTKGVETTPWNLAAENQVHNTGGVSFAVQQWLLSNMPDSKCSSSFNEPCTKDTIKSDSVQTDRWFTERGLLLLEEVARFWNSRLQFNEEKNAFEILRTSPFIWFPGCAIFCLFLFYFLY